MVVLFYKQHKNDIAQHDHRNEQRQGQLTLGVGKEGQGQAHQQGGLKAAILRGEGEHHMDEGADNEGRNRQRQGDNEAQGLQDNGNGYEERSLQKES